MLQRLVEGDVAAYRKQAEAAGLGLLATPTGGDPSAWALAVRRVERTLGFYG